MEGFVNQLGTNNGQTNNTGNRSLGQIEQNGVKHTKSTGRTRAKARIGVE